MSLGESQAARRSHRARVKRANRPDGLPIQTIPQENGSPESSPPDRPRRTHWPRSSRSWNCSKRYVIETRRSPPTSAQAGYPQENAQSSSPGLARSGIRSDNALLRSRVGRVAFRSTEAERCLQLWRGQPNRVRSERKQPCGFGSRVHAEAAFRLFCCAADTFAAPRSAAIERCPRVSSTPLEGTCPVGTAPAGSEKGENHLWYDCPQSFFARARGRTGRRRARGAIGDNCSTLGVAVTYRLESDGRWRGISALKSPRLAHLVGSFRSTSATATVPHSSACAMTAPV